MALRWFCEYTRRYFGPNLLAQHETSSYYVIGAAIRGPLACNTRSTGEQYEDHWRAIRGALASNTRTTGEQYEDHWRAIMVIGAWLRRVIRTWLRRVIGIWLRRVIGTWLRRVLVSGIDLDQYVCDTMRKKKKTQNRMYVIRGLIIINHD